jgi:hypothetical protein
MAEQSGTARSAVLTSVFHQKSSIRDAGKVELERALHCLALVIRSAPALRLDARQHRHLKSPNCPRRCWTGGASPARGRCRAIESGLAVIRRATWLHPSRISPSICSPLRIRHSFSRICKKVIDFVLFFIISGSRKSWLSGKPFDAYIKSPLPIYIHKVRSEKEIGEESVFYVNKVDNPKKSVRFSNRSVIRSLHFCMALLNVFSEFSQLFERFPCHDLDISSQGWHGPVPDQSPPG